MKKVPPQSMHKRLNRQRSFFAFGATALLAVAATAQVSTIDSRSYSEQLAACRSGATFQARESCVREVHAAQAALNRGQLGQQDSFTANALARCNAYRIEEDANACRARVMGQGHLSGSVSGGGLLREYEYSVPGQAPMPPQTPPATAMGAGAGPVVQPLPPIQPLPSAQPIASEPSRLAPDHPAARSAMPAQPVEPIRLQPELPAFPMYQK